VSSHFLEDDHPAIVRGVSLLDVGIELEAAQSSVLGSRET
jgi:hypothetical protein